MELNLKVSREEVLMIGTALAELPFKTTAGLILKLQSQVNEQEKQNGQKEPEKIEKSSESPKSSKANK